MQNIVQVSLTWGTNHIWTPTLMWPLCKFLEIDHCSIFDLSLLCVHRALAENSIPPMADPRGGRGFTPPPRVFFACQYMKITADLDPNRLPWRIPAQNRGSIQRQHIFNILYRTFMQNIVQVSLTWGTNHIWTPTLMWPLCKFLEIDHCSIFDLSLLCVHRALAENSIPLMADPRGGRGFTPNLGLFALTKSHVVLVW